MRAVRREDRFAGAFVGSRTGRARAWMGQASSVGSGLVLIGVAGVIAAALATWSVEDPSLSHATSRPASNALGFFGAALADLVMQLFGVAAVALVLPIAVWGWRLVARNPLDREKWRLAGWLVGLIACAGAVAAVPQPATWPLPTGLGGVVGDRVLGFPVALFGGADAFGRFVVMLVFGALAAVALALACGVIWRPAAPGGRAPFRDDMADDRSAAALGFLAHLGLTLRGYGARLAQRLRPAPNPPPAARPRVYAEDVDEAPPRRVRVEPRVDVRDAPRAAPRPAAPAAAPRAAPPRTVTPPPAPVWDDEDVDDLPPPSPPARSAARAEPRVEPRLEPAPPPKPQAPPAHRGMPKDERYDLWLETRPKPRGKGQPAPLPEPEPDLIPDDDEVDLPPEPRSRTAGSEQPAAPLWRDVVLDPDTGDDDMDDEPVAPGRAAARRTDTRPAPPPTRAEAPSRAEASGRPTPVRQQQPIADDEDEFDDEPPFAPEPPRRGPAAKPVRTSAQPVNVLRTGEHPYRKPALDLLAAPRPGERQVLSVEAIQENAGILEGVLEDFGVRGEIINARPGPVVTLYELEPAPGIKSSRVIGLSDDIARSMSAVSARVAVVPGRNVIGIELPNAKREKVYLREMLACEDYAKSAAKLPICLGKAIGGEPVIVDLARMPHLLIAGTTGSGKSVAINTMILSLLYRHKPEECRLIMVDPKMLELSVYEGIPHLLTPVVTDPKKAVVALKWAVREMEDRYKKMAKLGVRNIDGFNAKVAEARQKGQSLARTVQTGFDRETGEAVYEREELDLAPLPYIVVIVDEMADLMMVAGKDIEGAIQRLAQMARAAGIHVVLATQRPSVDVITGTIKANFPTRISFQVTSKIDSRTILGEMGAEQLLGQGDMLHMAGGGKISRVHGPFVSDDEVEKVVVHLKAQGTPQYLEDVTADDEEEEGGPGGIEPVGEGESDTDVYKKAIQLVLRDRKASTSYIQRRLQIGYNRAASLMERMERDGIVGPANHAGKREILSGREEE